MDAKRYLYSIRDEQKEIQSLERRINEAEMSLLPGGIRYDSEKVQTSPRGDTMADMVAKLDEYVQELRERVAVLTERKEKAQRIINQIDSATERTILSELFLSSPRMRIDQVADTIGRSTRDTYRKYQSAIEHFDEILSLNGS